MSFFYVAHTRTQDTFYEASKFHSGVPHLVALSLSVNAPLEAIGICSIVDGTMPDMATSLMAWYAMMCVDWTAVPSVLTSQFLSFVR